MIVYFNSDYTASKYSFDTTRKSAIIAKTAQQALGSAIQIVSPSPFYRVTRDTIRKTHDPKYVEAVFKGAPRGLAQSQGFSWDKNIYKMALAHNAGCVAGMDSAINGTTTVTLSSGLHHADFRSGGGFCTFNGLAVATNYAQDKGVENILIIDFDAHGGGGTYSLVGGKVTHIDLTTSAFDLYTIKDKRTKAIHSATDQTTYLKNAKTLLKFAGKFDHQVAIYNAGMDPFNSGVSEETLMKREKMVAEFLGEKDIPTVVTMAGGYSRGKDLTMRDIADLHTGTIAAFAEVWEPA